MKLRLIMIFSGVLLASQVSANEPLALKTQSDNLNYALGVEMAKNLKRQGIEVNPDVLMKGVLDGLSGKELLMSERDLRKTMIEYQSGQRLKRAGVRKSLPTDNRMQGYSSLEKHQPKEGMDTPPSGLQ